MWRINETKTITKFVWNDRDAINEVDGVLTRLGVCNTHFQFDNKYLHQSQNKQLKDFRRCISYYKYIAFFSRGAGCILHSWHLNKQNIQVPCIGQYTCEALRDCLPVCKRAFMTLICGKKVFVAGATKIWVVIFIIVLGEENVGQHVLHYMLMIRQKG